MVETKPKFFKSERAADLLREAPSSALQDALGNEDPRCFIFEEVNNWFFMALSNPKGTYCSVSNEERATFIEFYSDLLQLIEITFCVRLREVFFQEHERMPDWKELYEKFEIYYGLPYRFVFLRAEDIEQPNLIIRSFCYKYPIEYARRELWDFYETAYTYEGVFKDRVKVRDFPDHYEKLLTMLDACYEVTFKVGNEYMTL